VTHFDGLADLARVRDAVVDTLRARGEVRVVDLDGVVVDPVDRMTLRVLVLPGLHASGVVVVDGAVVHEARVRLAPGAA
jgi:hypothetical protein